MRDSQPNSKLQTLLDPLSGTDPLSVSASSGTVSATAPSLKSLPDGALSRDEYLIEVERLFAIRRPDLLRYLVRMGMHIVEAEDIVQDAFVRVVHDASRKQPENLFWWLLTCAKNIAINRFRRGKRETLFPAEHWKQWEHCLPDSIPAADDLLADREVTLRFRQSLATLNDVEQQCIVMRGQGIPFREIAAALDLPMRSVIHITSTAIRKLRQQMADLVSTE